MNSIRAKTLEMDARASGCAAALRSVAEAAKHVEPKGRPWPALYATAWKGVLETAQTLRSAADAAFHSGVHDEYVKKAAESLSFHLECAPSFDTLAAAALRLPANRGVSGRDISAVIWTNAGHVARVAAQWPGTQHGASNTALEAALRCCFQALSCCPPGRPLPPELGWSDPHLLLSMCAEVAGCPALAAFHSMQAEQGAGKGRAKGYTHHLQRASAEYSSLSLSGGLSPLQHMSVHRLVEGGGGMEEGRGRGAAGREARFLRPQGVGAPLCSTPSQPSPSPPLHRPSYGAPQTGAGDHSAAVTPSPALSLTPHPSPYRALLSCTLHRVMLVCCWAREGGGEGVQGALPLLTALCRDVRRLLRVPLPDPGSVSSPSVGLSPLWPVRMLHMLDYACAEGWVGVALLALLRLGLVLAQVAREGLRAPGTPLPHSLCRLLPALALACRMVRVRGKGQDWEGGGDATQSRARPSKRRRQSEGEGEGSALHTATAWAAAHFFTAARAVCGEVGRRCSGGRVCPPSLYLLEDSMGGTHLPFPLPPHVLDTLVENEVAALHGWGEEAGQAYMYGQGGEEGLLHDAAAARHARLAEALAEAQ